MFNLNKHIKIISFKNLKIFSWQFSVISKLGGGAIVHGPSADKNNYTIEQILSGINEVKICPFVFHRIRTGMHPGWRRCEQSCSDRQQQFIRIRIHTEFLRIERRQFSTLFQRHQLPASAAASLRTVSSSSSSSIHRGVCPPPAPLRFHPLLLHLITSCLQQVPAATRDFLRRRTTSNNRRSSSGGVGPTSPWSSWTSWKGCSMRLTIQTRSWERNSVSVWLCPKPGYRLVDLTLYLCDIQNASMVPVRDFRGPLYCHDICLYAQMDQGNRRPSSRHWAFDVWTMLQ